MVNLVINMKGMVISLKTLIGITYNLYKNAVTLPGEAPKSNYDTIISIKDALVSGGYDVELFEVTENLPLKLTEHKPDIVFNNAEGISGPGKEAQVPAILDYYRIPYTGSDETTILVAMDKALAKSLVSAYNVRTPKYNIIGQDMHSSGNTIPFPAIVKPIAEGSGRGISDVSVVYNSTDLNRILVKNLDLYKQKMLVEEYIQGREFTVGIIGNADDIRVFTPMEIVFNDKSNTLYSYEVKKNFKQYVKYVCPPDISEDVQTEIKKTAKEIYRILGCRDYARIDFRLSQDGLLYFLEVNPQPGLTPGYSDLPMISGFCGVDYNTLILNIMETALVRYGMK